MDSLSLIPNLGLFITARENVPDFRRSSITHLVSIGELDPKVPLIEDWAVKPHLYRFEFDDVISDKGQPAIYQPPVEADLARLLEIARTVARTLETGAQVNLLVHCSMGVSRSAAAAYVIINAIVGNGHEEECMNMVYQVRPVACPNYLLVAMGDRLLARGGAMTEAVRRHILRQWGPGARWGPTR
jgi:predicted protein tyrosine phosphatase